jgi:hypothetical protein
MPTETRTETMAARGAGSVARPGTALGQGGGGCGIHRGCTPVFLILCPRSLPPLRIHTGDASTSGAATATPARPSWGDRVCRRSLGGLVGHVTCSRVRGVAASGDAGDTRQSRVSAASRIGVGPIRLTSQGLFLNRYKAPEKSCC